jgi:hypothetical protein
MIYDAQGLKVELSAQDDPAPERRHTARVRLDNYGWNRPTLAGLLSALEAMQAAGVPQGAQIQAGWPDMYAHWSEPLHA